MDFWKALFKPNIQALVKSGDVNGLVKGDGA